MGVTCDPADLMVGEISSNAGHMCSQTVSQKMNPLPGQLQLFLQSNKTGEICARNALTPSKGKPAEMQAVLGTALKHSDPGRMWETIQKKDLVQFHAMPNSRLLLKFEVA